MTFSNDPGPPGARHDGDDRDRDDRDGDGRNGDGNGDSLEVPAWVGSQQSHTVGEGVDDDGPRPERTGELHVPPALGGAEEPPPAGPADGGDGYEPFLDFDGYDDRDYVRLPRRKGFLRRYLGPMAIVAVVALLAVAGAGYWVLRQVDPPGPPGAAVTVNIPEGANAGDIAKLLDRSGVVANDRIFKEYIRFKGEGSDGNFQAGTYVLNRHSSMAEALAALRRGPVPPAYAEVTLPEGLRVSAIASRLTDAVHWFDPKDVEAAFTRVRSPYQPDDVTTLEGLLFPDTYRIEEGETPDAALGEMVDEFTKVAGELQLDEGAAALGYTPYQVVTVASLIEREARVPEDRPKIARVIYNRLAADMRLDIDAANQYAVNGEGRALTQADLEVDSPYNTRLYKGLPPTPIAAPGRASLEAALHPADGDWLFYVLADADGHHYFTDNLSDFNDAVAAAEAKGLLG